MPAENATCYQRSPQAEESRVGDRAVVYHRISRKAVVLNPNGATIWCLLATPQTTQTLAEYLQAQFPTLTQEQAVSDVATFLQDLLHHDLVLSAE